MFKIYDGRSEFFQWDLDRKLIVSDPTVDEVHFCNKTDSCSLVCEVYEKDGLRLVDVPNILFQSHWDINVFGYCGGRFTKNRAKFKVNARSKPTDYVYTETEIKNWEDLEKKVKQVEEEMDNKISYPEGFKAQSGTRVPIFKANSIELEGALLLSSSPVAGAIPRYYNHKIDGVDNPVLRTATPQNDTDCANKKYVDDEVAKYVKTPEAVPQGYQTVIGYAAKGTTPTLWATGAYATSGAAGVIAKYNASGRLMSAEPINNEDVATKGYVDSKAGGAGGKTAYMHVFKLLDNQTPTSYYRVYISMKTSELQGFNAFEGYDMSEEVSFLVSGWDYDSGILNNIKIKQELYNDGEYAGYAIETLNGFSRICAENFTIVSEDII